MATKVASFNDYDAKTPSSIASSPRDVEGLDSDQTPTTLRHAAVKLARSAAPDSPRTPPTAYVLHDLWLAARHTRRDAEGLHGVLQIVHGYIHDLQQELISVAAEMERQKQAHDIKIMEKQCEIRLLEAESTAYSMAAMARTATVASLQQSTDALLEEREANTKALAVASSELEAKTTALQCAESAAESSTKRTQELESLLEKLQTDLNTAQIRIQELEKKETQHEATKLMLDAAQADASSAAGQLVDACEENAKLSEALGILQMELEQRDVELAEMRQEKNQLAAEIQQRDGQEEQIKNNTFSPVQNRSSASRRVQVAVKTHINPTFETPASVHSTATTSRSITSGALVAAVAAADPEDLLAMEISRLRMHTEDLEMQLAESKNAGPVLAALEKETGALRQENATLRIEVDHAALEAAAAQRELYQVQSEARILHGQLSEVISSLAGAGLAAAPIGLLQSLAPKQQQQQQQQLLALPSPSTSGITENGTEQHEEAIEKEEEATAINSLRSAAATVERKLPIAPSPVIEGTPSAVSSWKGPPTPTWEIAPASSSVTRSVGGGVGGGIGGGRPASESTTSNGGGDSILAELRSAMAQLDSVVSLDTSVEEPLVPKTAPLVAPVSLPTTAADILDSISRGIAALGGGNDSNDNEKQMYSSALSSSEGAATVTPRSG